MLNHFSVSTLTAATRSGCNQALAVVAIAREIAPSALGVTRFSKSALLKKRNLNEAGRNHLAVMVACGSIELGLPIEKPDDEFYKEIKAVYDDFAAELKLTERWNPIGEIGADNELQYRNTRCLLVLEN